VRGVLYGVDLRCYLLSVCLLLFQVWWYWLLQTRGRVTGVIHGVGCRFKVLFVFSMFIAISGLVVLVAANKGSRDRCYTWCRV